MNTPELKNLYNRLCKVRHALYIYLQDREDKEFLQHLEDKINVISMELRAIIKEEQDLDN